MQTKQVGMRIPNDLLEKVKAMAEEDGRSVTNMVVHLLRLQLKFHEESKGKISLEDAIKLAKERPPPIDAMKKNLVDARKWL